MSKTTTFAPMLYLKDVAAGIAFYTKAFGAIELRHFTNETGTVHVAEMSINNALFRLHEEVPGKSELSPDTLKGITTLIGVLVDDPDTVQANAVAAGATEIHPVKDYKYGFRQGTVADPFGHHWEIEKTSLVKKLFSSLDI